MRKLTLSKETRTRSQAGPAQAGLAAAARPHAAARPAEAAVHSLVCPCFNYIVAYFHAVRDIIMMVTLLHPISYLDVANFHSVNIY